MKTKDYDRALAFVAEMHACSEPSELRRAVVCGLSAIIGAERVTFEHFAPSVPRMWAVAEPDDLYLPWMWETFLAHIDEHPAVAHYRATGDLGAHKISDFVPVGAWHRTRLYRRLYKPLGYEDQMGVCLAPPGREFYSVVLSRGRRSFTERDRAFLTLLRPHIAQAHANALAFERIRRDDHHRNQNERCLLRDEVLLDRRGRVLSCNPSARRWIEYYFGEPFRINRLPESLDKWVRSQLRQQSRSGTIRSPLVRERRGRTLTLRLQRIPMEGRYAIVAEELSKPSPSDLHALGLTGRQVEVLLEVEKGKSNDEVASALFISTLTVRKHLENIFEILGVSNRTAAVSRMRQIVAAPVSGKHV